MTAYNSVKRQRTKKPTRKRILVADLMKTVTVFIVFIGRVPDVLFVPVNISYEKVCILYVWCYNSILFTFASKLDISISLKIYDLEDAIKKYAIKQCALIIMYNCQVIHIAKIFYSLLILTYYYMKFY